MRQIVLVKKVHKQLVPMAFLFFCMAVINTFLDSAKDAMVITLSGGGAEVLPFLLPYAVFPSSILFVVVFAWLSVHFSRRTLFNIITIFFTAYFVLFTAVLFPQRHLFEAHVLADWLSGVLPVGLLGVVAMVRTWVFTSFYVMAEMWGDVVLSLLFWGLANERTSVDDAHILYPLFGIGANLAQAVAGGSLRLMNSGALALEYDAFILMMMQICIALCAVIITVHHLVSTSESSKERESEARVLATGGSNGSAEVLLETQPKKKKKKASFKQAIIILSRSPQIKCLAIMSLCQGLGSNLLEITWKSHLRLLAPDPSSFTKYLGDVAALTGIATIGMMFFAPYLFTRFGWAFSASVTPRLLLYCGTVFFIGCIFLGYLPPPLYPTALGLMVAVGAFCYISSRASKFSLFKPAEEMVYISLDKESQTTGKAAVDVMGAQMGKAIGSCLQQVLLLCCGGSLFNFVPVLAVAFFFILRKWIKAVYSLATLHVAEESKADGLGSSVIMAADLSCPKEPNTDVDLQLADVEDS